MEGGVWQYLFRNSWALEQPNTDAAKKEAEEEVIRRIGEDSQSGLNSSYDLNTYIRGVKAPLCMKLITSMSPSELLLLIMEAAICFFFRFIFQKSPRAVPTAVNKNMQNVRMELQ